MFCPQCRSEYQPGFIRCADCDVELVDFLPEEEDLSNPPTEDLDYVTVATAMDPLEESQIVSFLRSSGIEARVVGQGLRKIYPSVTYLTAAGARIMVPREDEAVAKELLERAESGEWEIEAPDSEE
jgi:hypothetical protein